MIVLNYIVEHWGGFASLIAIIVSIVTYCRQSRLSKRIRISEIDQEIIETKYNKERAISNKNNHRGFPLNAQEIGHFFEKENEYGSEISCSHKKENDLIAQRKKLEK